MREIKFRVWDKDRKYMGVVETIDWGNNSIGYIFGGQYWINKLNSVDLLQFTGLKDKNGKEIYEGDIVRFEDEEWQSGIYKVVWEEDCAGFTLQYPNGRDEDWEYNPFSGNADIEIIGNIYEMEKPQV